MQLFICSSDWCASTNLFLAWRTLRSTVRNDKTLPHLTCNHPCIKNHVFHIFYRELQSYCVQYHVYRRVCVIICVLVMFSWVLNILKQNFLFVVCYSHVQVHVMIRNLFQIKTIQRLTKEFRIPLFCPPKFPKSKKERDRNSKGHLWYNGHL